MESLRVATGQHYRNTKKDTVYEVVCRATHSETEEEMVVYRDVITGRSFVRPIAMFLGTRVGADGTSVPRFVLEAADARQE